MSKAARTVALYLDKSTNDTPSWLRIKKSTVLTISYNPETEDFDYIADDTKTTEVKAYAPAIDQDLAILPNEEDYEFVNGMRKKLPVGKEAHLNCLLVYLNDGTSSSGFYAEKTDAVITFNDYNAVDGVIDFNIGFCGTPEKGTATIVEGVPTFSKSSLAALNLDEE